MIWSLVGNTQSGLQLGVIFLTRGTGKLLGASSRDSEEEEDHSPIDIC